MRKKYSDLGTTIWGDSGIAYTKVKRAEQVYIHEKLIEKWKCDPAYAERQQVVKFANLRDLNEVVKSLDPSSLLYKFVVDWDKKMLVLTF